MTTTQTTACSTAITPRDFLTSTADPRWTRNLWDSGYLRHVVQALAGQPVAIVLDKQTGHAVVGAVLESVTSGTRWSSTPHLAVRTEHGVVLYNIHNVGTIIPLGEPIGKGGAKWEALQTVREECSAALDQVRAQWEAEGCDYGKWEMRPTVTKGQVVVSYSPQREGAGKFRYQTVRVG